MPKKMKIPWDFTPHDGPHYLPGVREVADRHVPTALSLGATFIEEGEKRAVTEDVENRGSQTDEKTPPAKKTEKATASRTASKPKPNLDKWNADKKRAKELGYTGSLNKKDVEAFLAAHDKPPWTAPTDAPDTPFTVEVRPENASK